MCDSDARRRAGKRIIPSLPALVYSVVGRPDVDGVYSTGRPAMQNSLHRNGLMLILCLVLVGAPSCNWSEPPDLPRCDEYGFGLLSPMAAGWRDDHTLTINLGLAPNIYASAFSRVTLVPGGSCDVASFSFDPAQRIAILKLSATSFAKSAGTDPDLAWTPDGGVVPEVQGDCSIDLHEEYRIYNEQAQPDPCVRNNHVSAWMDRHPSVRAGGVLLNF